MFRTSRSTIFPTKLSSAQEASVRKLYAQLRRLENLLNESRSSFHPLVLRKDENAILPTQIRCFEFHFGKLRSFDVLEETRPMTLRSTASYHCFFDPSTALSLRGEKKEKKKGKKLRDGTPKKYECRLPRHESNMAEGIIESSAGGNFRPRGWIIQNKGDAWKKETVVPAENNSIGIYYRAGRRISSRECRAGYTGAFGINFVVRFFFKRRGLDRGRVNK